MFIKVIKLAIFFEIILSFLSMAGIGINLYEMIRAFTSPILGPFEELQEKIIPGLPIGLAPIFAYLVLDLFQSLVISVLL